MSHIFTFHAAVIAVSSNGNAFVVPEGLTVSEISVIDNELLVEDYATGDVVPANTGVLMSATTAGDKTITLSAEAGTSVLGEDNMLKPSGDAGITAANMTVADTKFYRLTMHNGTTIGFWWGAADGAAFDLAANKAYLLHSENAGSYTLTRTSDVSEPDANLLAISDGTTDNGVYVLANGADGAGFYRWMGGKLGAGRVYLPAPMSIEARQFLPFGFGETTGISASPMNHEKANHEFYDLQGRRLNGKPTQKGFYIYNGKKLTQ